MAIPLPTSGLSKQAAILEALASYLETETSYSWRGGLFPPSEIDSPIGAIRPYTESPPGTDDASTFITLQLLFQCRTADQNIVEATGNMMSWKEFIAISLANLQALGVSGVYRGVQLTGALQGIHPIQLSGGSWSQISIELSDRRADQGQGILVVRLLMNYQLPVGNVDIEKRWLNL